MQNQDDIYTRVTNQIIVSFRQGCVSHFDGLAIVAVFLGVENGHGGKAA